jgi:hypothetical protein
MMSSAFELFNERGKKKVFIFSPFIFSCSKQQQQQQQKLGFLFFSSSSFK